MTTPTLPSLAVHGFSESVPQAHLLAENLGAPYADIEVHRFPDGESLVRVDGAAETVVVYRSLDVPNDKLIELMLAASALRDGGAKRLVLVTPYLCYMRQDMAFHPGEAVSQKVVCGFLDNLFDAVITVDPHLHRTSDLSSVFPTARAEALSAAPLLAARLQERDIARDTILVGPDGESRQWVEAVAAPLSLDVLVGQKERAGDRKVAIEIPGIERAAGRAVILVDDVISTGMTLAGAARLLLEAGATGAEVMTVHMLDDPTVPPMLRDAGIARIESSDSVPHDSNAVRLAPMLADSVRRVLGQLR